MHYSGGGYGQQAMEQGEQMMKAEVQNTVKKNFLQLIPRQVGPPSAYALRIQKTWMRVILFALLVLALLRLFWLMDFLGSFWMFGVLAIGVYAWYEDMNIQIVCVWGLACLLNGLLDIVAMIIPLAVGLLTLDFLGVLVRIGTPLSELLGAALAWDLYCNCLEDKGEKASYPNPFRMFFQSTERKDALGTALAAGQEVERRIEEQAYKQQNQRRGGKEQSPLAGQQDGAAGGGYGAFGGAFGRALGGAGAGADNGEGAPPGFEGHAPDRPGATAFPRPNREKQFGCC